MPFDFQRYILVTYQLSAFVQIERLNFILLSLFTKIKLNLICKQYVTLKLGHKPVTTCEQNWPIMYCWMRSSQNVSLFNFERNLIA